MIVHGELRWWRCPFKIEAGRCAVPGPSAMPGVGQTFSEVLMRSLNAAETPRRGVHANRRARKHAGWVLELALMLPLSLLLPKPRQRK